MVQRTTVPSNSNSKKNNTNNVECCFLPTDARLLRTHTRVCVPLLSH
jgi:hypothetical protein